MEEKTKIYKHRKNINRNKYIYKQRKRRKREKKRIKRGGNPLAGVEMGDNLFRAA